MESRLIIEAIFYQSNVVRYTEFVWRMRLVSSLSPIADIESEILQEKLENLIRGKEDIKI